MRTSRNKYRKYERFIRFRLQAILILEFSKSIWSKADESTDGWR